MERSRNDSSREETVSQVRHLVSLVRTPSKSLWTRVAVTGPERGIDDIEAVTTNPLSTLEQ